MKTVSCLFIRTTATYDDTSARVVLHVENSEETIDIAAPSEWKEEGQSGYIGMGFTKRGIYYVRL